MQIFVSGSLAFDRIMSFPGRFSDHILPDKIHILNVCFVVDGMEEKFGGTAGNIAYNLALLGERPLIVGCAGRDFAPYAAWLEKLGLPLSGIRVIEEDFTAGAYITTDQADNQITGFNPAAMRHSSRFDFAAVDPNDSLVIVSPGNVEDMCGHPRVCRKLGIPYVFDPGQQITVLSGAQLAEAVEGSLALVTNDYELELIKKATELDTEQLLGLTRAIVTTLGEQGSRIVQKNIVTEVPAVPARTVADPTGAGDAFRAGLLKGLAQGLTLPEAARLGSTCASFAVEHKGTQVHCFTDAEFSARFASRFGRTA
jgi:adenosine kinase